MTIYCECYNDEALLRALGLSRKKIKHKSNKSEACKSLRKASNSIALIDADPGKLQDKYSEELIETYNSNDIIVREDIKTGNRIILISPELEPWVNKALSQTKIDISKYHLPTDLHDIGTNDHKLFILRTMIRDALPNSIMLRDLQSKF